MNEVTLITDGACSGNPGVGGWGAILRWQGQEKELHGGSDDTTNNRMELTAVIKGLRALQRQCTVHIITDSKYVLQGATEWAPRWQKNNWRKADKKPVENQDLWRELLAELARHETTWEWVKGHAGNADNERADALARRYQESR